MSLLLFREKIHTECDSLGNPILNIQAIKIDGNHDSLKRLLGCSQLKSFDYFKRYKGICYFIEISDFNRELKDLKDSGMDINVAEKSVKEGVRLKISDTLLIYKEMITKYSVNEDKKSAIKILLISCDNDVRRVQALDFLSRNLQQHYMPKFCSSVKVLPYIELERFFLTS